uniref:adenylate kinase n=1 Tax=Tetradesmus obliquus TaxID=3088 RepID=A0A383VHU9_TETOB|eukprot:jgi/Sobl393_1/5483/SZX64409.1
MQQQASRSLLRAAHASLKATWFSSSVAPAAAAAYSTSSSNQGQIKWVFLGPPGVGKGTYASRVAAALDVPHIAAGDLVRAEIKSGSTLGQQMQQIVSKGQLLPDEVIIEVLQQRLQQGRAAGEGGFILDGFPRTAHQAQQLAAVTQVQLALNLSLRHEVLVQKCCGRRICGHCGKNYNIADIYLPADPASGQPEIVMPPLSPPKECEPHLETREDDTEEVVLRRLQVYNAAAAPVEDFYRASGLLLDFEITGGIPQTLPRLMASLQPYIDAARSSSSSSSSEKEQAAATA